MAAVIKYICTHDTELPSDHNVGNPISDSNIFGPVSDSNTFGPVSDSNTFSSVLETNAFGPVSDTDGDNDYKDDRKHCYYDNDERISGEDTWKDANVYCKESKFASTFLVFPDGKNKSLGPAYETEEKVREIHEKYVKILRDLTLAKDEKAIDKLIDIANRDNKEYQAPKLALCEKKWRDAGLPDPYSTTLLSPQEYVPKASEIVGFSYSELMRWREVGFHPLKIISPWECKYTADDTIDVLVGHGTPTTTVVKSGEDSKDMVTENSIMRVRIVTGNFFYVNMESEIFGCTLYYCMDKHKAEELVKVLKNDLSLRIKAADTCPLFA